MTLKLNFKYNYDFMLLFGRKHSGKTYFTSYLLQRLNPNQVIIIDTNGDFQKANPQLANRCIRIPYTQQALIDIIQKIRENYTNMLIIIDDIDAYGLANQNEALQGLAINGRHKGLGLIAIARRPINMNLLLNNADFVLLGYGLKLKDWQYIDDNYRDIPNIELNYKMINKDEDNHYFYLISAYSKYTNQIVRV